MKRIAQDYLKAWFHRPRRKPLILRGARQVGKSTLVRQFAQETGLKLAEINLEKHRHLDTLFQSLDLERILPELESLWGQSLAQPNTLLFLDEIQATPHALPMLRYFFEEKPELPVIAAGSLLEFVLQDHAFSMPVGRIEYLALGPMDFKEFLLALGEDFLVQAMENFSLSQSWPESAHLKLKKRQREFLLVGGMPEAVLEYTQSESLSQVQRIQENILATYQDDFAKYRRSVSDLPRLQRVFRAVAKQVGQKIKYVQISREEQAREIKGALELLSLANVITLVHRSDCSSLPLGAGEDPHNYKALFLDVGLLTRMNHLDWQSLSKKEDNLLINEGALAEQFIGQHLLFQNTTHAKPRLYYWLREGRSNNAEVDYVIDQAQSIIPIEVKAGKSGSLKSLHQFYLAKKPVLMVRFDLNPPSLNNFSHQVKMTTGFTPIHYRVLSLPLYFVGELRRLIEETIHAIQ